MCEDFNLCVTRVDRKTDNSPRKYYIRRCLDDSADRVLERFASRTSREIFSSKCFVRDVDSDKSIDGEKKIKSEYYAMEK